MYPRLPDIVSEISLLEAPRRACDGGDATMKNNRVNYSAFHRINGTHLRCKIGDVALPMLFFP